MAWTYTVRPSELVGFRRCRRAWDLSAVDRQAYAPKAPSAASDFRRAIHEGLAVYYFPAMGDWKRSIVRPLAIKGFERRMAQGWTGEQPGPGSVAAIEGDGTGQTLEERIEAGRALLTSYFRWAEGIDDFDSLLVDHDVWAPVPDPRQSETDLGTPDGRPIRYLGRIDQLVGDPDDEYWIVRHRPVEGGWMSDEDLVDDEVALADSWAIQIDFPQLVLAGTIINEIRTDMPIDPTEVPVLEDDQWDMSGARHLNPHRSPITPEARLAACDAAEAAEMGHIAERQEEGRFRRTVVRRSQAALARAGQQVGADVLEMQRPDLPVFPTLSLRCAECAFKAACDAMEAGLDWSAVLDEGYFQPDEEWQDRSLRRPPGSAGTRVSLSSEQTRTVNFRWG